MMALEKMVERFQCPGCVAGSDTKCGSFRLDPNMNSCGAHVLGTFSIPAGSFALGLPKGFCRAGFEYGSEPKHRNRLPIRFWPEGTAPKWNDCNVAVWAMEGRHSPDKDHHGFLFVRTVMPRMAAIVVDVIEGGTLALVPDALDVSTFIGEID